MSEYKVASRYAKALIDLAKEQKSVDTALKEMRDFRATLKSNHQIGTMLKSPVISSQDKVVILNKLFAKSYSKSTMDFFAHVINSNRGMYLETIAGVFIELYNTDNNIMQASVKTASPIDEKMTAEIKSFVEKYTGKKIELKSIVDPRLIGGMVIQMGDKLFDASISGKLNKLKHDLLNTYISK